MRDVVWTKLAKADLEAIIAYVAADSPKAALDQIEAIETQSNALHTHPQLGRRGRLAGTRELVIARTPYIVVYRLRTRAVDVLRVLHGARQWPPRP